MTVETVQLKMPVLRGKSDYFDVIFKESWVVGCSARLDSKYRKKRKREIRTIWIY